MNVEYDAFVSYSHESDREFAPALKAGVEKLAKPWNRLRALRLFLDTASLSADPALWTSIEKALERSSWFVLITSTSAARSRWVERELAWWLEHRSVDRLLLVVTEGELAWEGDRFDTERSTALPPILLTAFPQEPRWVDSRETDAVAEVAATLRGIPKDELVGEAVRQHRRTMRVARTAIAALATLLALAVVAAIVALGQRNSAREQARIATARQLASVSTRELTSNLDIALLLAVQAERMDPSPQTRSALLQAATASPALVRYLQAGGQVTQVAGSGDGKTVVAGLDDGRVQRFSVANARRETLFDLPGAVTGLAVSRDAATVVATDGTQARLRQGAATSAPFPAYSVGLSPSGRTLVFREGQPFDPGTISVVDAARRTLRGTHPASFLPHSGTATVLLPASDDELLLLDGGYGYWQRRRISDWAVEAEGRGSFGAQHLSGIPSANGAFFSASNGGQPISVWPTDRARRPLTAEAPIASGRAPALSPDGSRLAVPDSGQVYVAGVAPATSQHPAPVRLTGMGSTNVDGLAFIGDASHLVSATRDKLALWDLGQLDRLGRPRELPVGSSCNACDGPAVTVSPDGRRAAIIDGSEGKALILPLAGGRTEELPDLQFGARYAAAVWVANRLALPLEGEEGPESLPPSVGAWPAATQDAGIETAGLAADGRSVIVVDGRGKVELRDAAGGAVRRTGLKLAAGDDRLDSAAVHAAPDLVAAVVKGVVTVADPHERKVIARIPGSTATSVHYAGGRLLVQRATGSLEVWNARGTARERVLPGDGTYAWPPVGNRQGTLVARRRTDGGVVLADLDTGAVLATLRMPGGSIAKSGVAFSPDGKRLITVTSAGADATSQLVQRDLSDAALIRSACATAGRDLSAAEWRDFVGTEPPADLRCG